METIALENEGQQPAASQRVRQAFDQLQVAYQRDRFPSLDRRKKWLIELLRMTRDRADDIARAASEDFGSRSVHESKLGEIWVTVANLNYLIDHFEEWVEPQPKSVSAPLWFGRAEVRAQPKGVVGIISPWNYPFMLAVEPLAGALAAGNRVVLKLSEYTPRSSALVAEELQKRLPSDLIRVFWGGADEGRALSSVPLDHLLFTGSSEVGRKVYLAAAENLVPVTLELGGKSPAILHPSFSVKRFAKSVISGKCFSAGQSCIAPDYLLVPEGHQEHVIDALRKRFAESYPTLRDNPDYSAVAGERRYARLVELREEARQLGADVIELNPADEELAGINKLPLTLLVGVPDEARIMKEEIFGPLLPVVSYRELAEAMRYVNQRPRPLALYYFDDRKERVERILTEVTSGGVTVNDTLLHFVCEALPRAGTGQSGMGAYQGRMSFETFSHQKSVFHQSRFNGLDVLRPPYGKNIAWVLRWLIRG